MPSEATPSQRTVIEFVGIPGSGKSFLTNHLSAGSDFATLNFMSRTEGRLAAYLRYAGLGARMFGDIMRTLKQSGTFSRSKPEKIRRWQLKLLLRAVVLADRIGREVRPGSTRIQVLDQGVLQSLLSCRMAGIYMDRRMVDRLLTQARTLPDTRLVLLHAASSDIAMSSIQTRLDNQLPALTMFDGIELQALFARYQEAFGWIEAELHNRNYSTLRTDRADPTEYTLSRIRAKMQMKSC
ncbi:MAG: hypothetical protein AB8B94_16510 [Hyphomicrobiales bacterium]